MAVHVEHMSSTIRRHHQPPTIEWITAASALARLEGPWRALEAAVTQRTHVSGFDFLYPWYCHYAGEYGGTPLVGAAWEGRDLVGIAPLTLRRGSLGRVPVRRVDFAPNDSVAGEFLVPDDRPDVVESLIDSLEAQRGFDVVCLNGFESGSRLVPAIEAAAHRRRFSTEMEEHAFARVDLRDGYDAYWRRLDGDVRRKLTHRARKIRALGAAVDGVICGRSRDAARARADRIIAITEASHKLCGQSLAPHHRAFLTDVIERFAERGMLGLPILTIGGRDAAFIVGIVEHGCFYDVTLSYDESFAKLGPGMFLMQETLRQLADAGIGQMISHGAHEYKRSWATAFIPQTRVYLFPPRPRARLCQLVRFGLGPLMRRVGTSPQSA